MKEVVIPEGVKGIGNSAFYGCSSLTSITIPEGVTTIGCRAFKDCESLTDVTIPEGVTTIGDCTFKGCTFLEGVTIPKSVTTIGCRAFKDCDWLTDVTIPDSMTKIDEMAFENCTSLTSVTIPDSATKFGWGAFEGCTNLPYIDFHGDHVFIQSSAADLREQIEMQRTKNYGVKMDHSIKYPILWKRYADNPEEPELLAYIKKKFSEMFPFAIGHDDVETVKFVCEQETLLTTRNIGKMIEVALKQYQDGGSGEILTVLQDYLADMAQTATLPQLKKFFGIANAHDLTELKMRVMHIKHERFPEDEQQENDFSLD